MSQRKVTRAVKEYTAALPSGFPARKITIQFSVPNLPVRPPFAFTDHAVDDAGCMTNTVLAATVGGFAISRDLGQSWEQVRVKDRARHTFIHVKAIGRGELLAQALPPHIESKKDAPLDLLVLNESGDILAEHRAFSLRWHGCRAMDIRGDAMMYAEYPSNRPVKGRRPHASRVLRSRDRGRSWQTVFTQTGKQIRHFHFLQARPGASGEWWLASGDLAHECHIWRSVDDGDTWADLTAGLPNHVDVDGALLARGMFRLTDLFWLDDQVIWATDDYLGEAKPPGARIFQSAVTNPLSPHQLALGRRQFRSIVDIGDFLLFISQRSREETDVPEDRKPGIYLMPKKGGAPVIHLFNLDSQSTEDNPGFTFSKASRAAVDGTFFSFRSPDDVFPAGNKILRWKVILG